MDTRFDEHTVAAVCICKCNVGTADTSSVVEQVAKTSKILSRVAKIVEMLISRYVKKTNCKTSPQQIHNKSRTFGNIVDLRICWTTNPPQVIQVEFGLYTTQ